MQTIFTIETSRPDAFMLEYADNLRYISNGRVANTIINRLRDAGYNVYDNIVNTKHNGLLQTKARLWTIVMNRDTKIGSFIRPEPIVPMK